MRVCRAMSRRTSTTATRRRWLPRFASAAHVTRLEIPSNCIVVCPMEPRSAIAEYDAEGDRYTLRVGCQGVFGLKAGIANVLAVDKEKVRVLTGNVGGS